MVTLAGIGGIVIAVGEQKSDWSRLKRECGEANCNEEKGKERNEAVAIEEVRSGVAFKKIMENCKSHIKIDVTHYQKTHSQCNVICTPIDFIPFFMNLR